MDTKNKIATATFQHVFAHSSAVIFALAMVSGDQYVQISRAKDFFDISYF